MIPIETKVPHGLGQAAALERMHELVASLTERYPQQVHQVQLSLRANHISVRFAAYGYIVEWEADIEADGILLAGRIPDSAKPYRNKIEQAITARVEAALLDEVRRAA